MQEQQPISNEVQRDELSETLLVLDNQKHTLQAVSGMDKKGKLKTVDPKKENNPDFIRLDKQGDFLSNFFSNFMRQVKNPTRFRFFKVPVSEVESVAEKIKNHLDNPSQAGDKMLQRYEVKPDKQVLDKRTAQDTGQTTEPENNNQQKQEQTMETPTTNATDYRYKVEDIDWNTLNGMGITQEKLEKMNVLDDLLKGFKTNQLVPVSLNLGTVITRADARLSLQPDENGNVVMAMHGIRKEPALHFPFFGHTFTEEDKGNLLKTGNMGRIVNLENIKTGETIPSIISVDRLTNELVALRADKIRIPDEIKGVKLNEEQKQTLMEGKPLYLEGMISKNNTEFAATVQFNADKRYVEFLFDRNLRQNQTQQQTQGEAPRKIRGKELSETQYQQLKSGETIYVNDFADKLGKPYKGYLTYNTETGKTSFSFRNPNKKGHENNSSKQSAPAEEAKKTRKAANPERKNSPVDDQENKKKSESKKTSRSPKMKM